MSAPVIGHDAFCPECGSARLPGASFCMQCRHKYAGLTASQGARKGLFLKRVRPMKVRGANSDLFYVILASLLAVVLSHLPILDVLTYPFKLFATFVHEWSHAFVGVLTGGQVTELQINADFSGETFTRGGWLLSIASAGYTGAAIWGALLLLTPTRFSNRLLVAIGAISLLMPLVGAISFGTQFTSNTWVWAAVFGAVSLLVGLRASPRIARLFHQFVAVELCFTTLDSIRYLIWLSGNCTTSSPACQSDATNAASYTHIGPLFWSILWGVIAVVAIGLAAWRVVRRSVA
ncbi:MAG TPA: M50 family metallopeptidase [Chloroflexota bacterium]|nr:M50 family metallopeptidase [Chloroflexota bacterium]